MITLKKYVRDNYLFYLMLRILYIVQKKKWLEC